MSCLEPPCNTTEPMSTFTRTVRAAANVPDEDWLEPRDSCAISGATRASTTTSPTNCGVRFKSTTSAFLPRNLNPTANSRRFKSHSRQPPRSLINLRQLRQHGPRLRLDVLALILRGQRHQYAAHAAVGFHRLNQAQRFGADARIGVVYQRAQNRV